MTMEPAPRLADVVFGATSDDPGTPLATPPRPRGWRR
jgi:hypothetical protein